MHTLDTRVATGVFDPGNPSQRAETYYAGWPGQYATFYTNGVPDYGASVNLGRHGTPVSTVFTSIKAGLRGLAAPHRPVYHPTCSPGCYYVSGHGCKCPPPRHFLGAGLGGFASWSPVAQAATIGALAIATYFATKRLRTHGLLGGRRRRRR